MSKILTFSSLVMLASFQLSWAKVNSPAARMTTPSAVAESQLDNPVAKALSAELKKNPKVSYEFKAWTQNFLLDHFEAFAHLKTVMQPQVDELESSNLRSLTQAAFLYSLYRLNLAQTFVDQWMESMDHESFAKSVGATALDAAIASKMSLESWFFEHKIQLSSDEEAVIKKIGASRNANWLMLNAWIQHRQGLAAESMLTKLPVNSALRPKLSMTVSLAYARKGDVSNAARVLKSYYQPWVLQSKDAKAVSSYALQIARLLYQAGSIDGAIEYYSQIPNGSPDYLTAREELAWCWLRQGNLEQLRGNLTTLTSSVMSDQFRPESFLVKSISDLKLCFYGDVEKDFQQFLKVNAPWTKKIETGIHQPESATPRIVDADSQYAMDAFNLRKVEVSELEKLGTRSVSASLPAVGTQKHWRVAMKNAQDAVESAKKIQAEEFRREWKNDRAILVEAIRKMQFVKVELLSQMGQMEQLTTTTVTSPAAEQNEVSMKADLKANADQTYPFDGVVWPDELFKLRSLSNGKCVGQM